MSNNCENSIREAAYYLWLQAGSPEGQDDYFWALAANSCCNKKAKASCGTKKMSASAPSATSSNSSAKKAKTVSAASTKKTTVTKKSK